jgi:hypothetical protein
MQKVECKIKPYVNYSEKKWGKFSRYYLTTKTTNKKGLSQ